MATGAALERLQLGAQEVRGRVLERVLGSLPASVRAPAARSLRALWLQALVSPCVDARAPLLAEPVPGGGRAFARVPLSAPQPAMLPPLLGGGGAGGRKRARETYVRGAGARAFPEAEEEPEEPRVASGPRIVQCSERPLLGCPVLVRVGDREVRGRVCAVFNGRCSVTVRTAEGDMDTDWPTSAAPEEGAEPEGEGSEGSEESDCGLSEGALLGLVREDVRVVPLDPGDRERYLARLHLARLVLGPAPPTAPSEEPPSPPSPPAPSALLVGRGETTSRTHRVWRVTLAGAVAGAGAGGGGLVLPSCRLRIDPSRLVDPPAKLEFRPAERRPLGRPPKTPRTT